MFEFEGDHFNATAVAAITRDGSSVYITTYGQNSGFEYDFDDEESAKTKVLEAATRWKAALS
jgi:hypothetical protein